MSETSLKAALVTGAGQRIGRAIALDLGGRGWSVAVHYHGSHDAAQEVCEEIRRLGGRAVAIRANLDDEREVDNLAERAAETVGPLTCLVNNASIFEKDTPETVTRESWNAHMQINLRAPFVLIQRFVAQLPQDVAGNVINIIDQRVWNLTGAFTSYTVSKSALWTLTRTLALALAPRVRVNAVGPGPTLPSPRQTDEHFRRQWQDTPLCRRVELTEICNAVRFILDAPSMTGQMVALDSGQHLGWATPSQVGDIEE